MPKKSSYLLLVLLHMCMGLNTNDSEHTKSNKTSWNRGLKTSYTLKTAALPEPPMTYIDSMIQSEITIARGSIEPWDPSTIYNLFWYEQSITLTN